MPLAINAARCSSRLGWASIPDLVCRHHLHHHPTKALLLLLLLLMQGLALQPMENPPPSHPHRPLLACLALLSVLAPLINPLLLTTKEGAQAEKPGKSIFAASSSLQASADASSPCKPALYALPLSLLVRPPHFQPRPAYPDRPSRLFRFSSYGTTRYLILFWSFCSPNFTCLPQVVAALYTCGPSISPSAVAQCL